MSEMSSEKHGAVNVVSLSYTSNKRREWEDFLKGYHSTNSENDENIPE